jgi:hypothetical protein
MIQLDETKKKKERSEYMPALHATQHPIPSSFIYSRNDAF